MGSHQKGVDSTANTPIGSPSAYTPMAGSKRKIMSIHGRSDSITGMPMHFHAMSASLTSVTVYFFANVESKDEPDRKHAATSSTSATTTVVPNGAPPLGRLSHSNLASTNDARTTQKLNTGELIQEFPFFAHLFPHSLRDFVTSSCRQSQWKTHEDRRLFVFVQQPRHPGPVEHRQQPFPRRRVCHRRPRQRRREQRVGRQREQHPRADAGGAQRRGRPGRSGDQPAVLARGPVHVQRGGGDERQRAATGAGRVGAPRSGDGDHYRRQRVRTCSSSLALLLSSILMLAAVLFSSLLLFIYSDLNPLKVSATDFALLGILLLDFIYFSNDVIF